MTRRRHPIFYPAFKGDLTLARKILRADPAAITARDAQNLTPLHVAASRGQHRVIELLLKKGADITGPSRRDEWTPLVFASYRGHLEAVRMLLKFGAQANDKAGNPIHYAGQRGHKEICRLLVEHGAVDNLVRTKDADLLGLFRAAYSFDHLTVDQILQRRPKWVNRKDKHGRTPLHEACTHGDTRTVRVLIKHEADTTIADKAGQTPLDRARSHGKRAVIKILEAV